MRDKDDAYDDDALAAEYVLHLLDADARRTFERRLRTDRALLPRVQSWEADLAPLSDEFVPVAPPPALKSRIMRNITPAQRPSSLRSVWFYLLGGAVAAAIAWGIVFSDVLRSPADLSPEFQADLAAEDGSLILLAGVIPATHEIVIERIAGEPGPGRVHELWLVAEGADAPVSLGVLKNQGTTRIRVPDEIAPGVRTGTVAISDEPLGGSPTGAPTGEILAAARFNDL